MLQQEYNFKEKIIFYLFIYSLFNRFFFFELGHFVPAILLDSVVKVVSKTVILPPLQDLWSNKKYANFIQGKYKLMWIWVEERASGLVPT